MSKALRIPLDKSFETLLEIPYTISYVIRKRQQIDNLSELGKEKFPPDEILWEGTPEQLDDWIDRVVGKKKKEQQSIILKIKDKEVEGA